MKTGARDRVRLAKPQCDQLEFALKPGPGTSAIGKSNSALFVAGPRFKAYDFSRKQEHTVALWVDCRKA